jgi:hypothetical protein
MVTPSAFERKNNSGIAREIMNLSESLANARRPIGRFGDPRRPNGSFGATPQGDDCEKSSILHLRTMSIREFRHDSCIVATLGRDKPFRRALMLVFQEWRDLK